MTDRELMQQALDVLEDWDSLIQHQYNGSKKAMSDLTICAQSTPPIIDAIKARLAQHEMMNGLTEEQTNETMSVKGLTQPEKTVNGWPLFSGLPQPEPVAWFTEDHREDKSATTYSKKMSERWKEKGWPVTPLYTAPPKKEWVGLTNDEQLEAIWGSGKDGLTGDRYDVALAIEAKLKEKNSG